MAEPTYEELKAKLADKLQELGYEFPENDDDDEEG